MTSHEKITLSLQQAKESRGVALVPFITAGYPHKESFSQALVDISKIGDVVEIGIPFSDPMADGMTIQRSSHAALQNGVNLSWIFDQIDSVNAAIEAPLVMMSYLNPLLAFGYENLTERSHKAGVCGFIVPDLPLEESVELSKALNKKDLGLIQLVTPVTPKKRMAQLCEASKGFVYAVTMTGITGSETGLSSNISSYLDEINQISSLPVCAGFGIRSASDVTMIGQHATGAIVGSALVEAMENKQDIVSFLNGLRET
ncbi:MAG: tryptophan synthase subunit alpha [Pseudomonadota bacterium]|nr:tryptophan synthase subunit alpha [Pseudomonadota bacterium]